MPNNYLQLIIVSEPIKMAENSCCELLNRLIADIQNLDYAGLLAQAEQKYGVREFKISQITPINAFQIYNNVYTKSKKNHSPKTELNWWENQLRIFIWILLCYLQLRGLQIEDLCASDWQFFSRLFPNKQEILFEYQALSLMRDNINTKKWAQEEDQIFAALVTNRGHKYKWSELAKELYIASERKFYRTPKQCRERWLNHLDPNKSKQEWELREDYILITHVRNKGKKWAEISKMLKNRRNEHSIKNRYKSLITKEEKLHDEQLEEQVVLECIFRKYQNHFAKLRQTVSISAQTHSECSIQEEKKTLPSTENIIINRKAFQFCPPSSKSNQKEQLSYQSLDLPMQRNEEFAFPASNAHSMTLIADKEQRQKEIRAEMFLCADPFDFLRRFFKSRDEIM